MSVCPKCRNHFQRGNCPHCDERFHQLKTDRSLICDREEEEWFSMKLEQEARQERARRSAETRKRLREQRS